VEALTAIDVVRNLPGMYVGDTDGPGVFHMVLEVVANAYDRRSTVAAGHFTTDRNDRAFSGLN